MYFFLFWFFIKILKMMNDVAYEKVIEALLLGHQVLLFVHSRKDTANTARAIRDSAQKNDSLHLFSGQNSCNYSQLSSRVNKSRDGILRELFGFGIGCHHAGMLRNDRNLVEKLFDKGAIKLLCCTATLAWGVNLPAHTVIIKGTQIYNAEKGGFSDLDVLDVQQIFGRAGRPQYVCFIFFQIRKGIIITSHDKLNHYLRLMTHQIPIESTFVKALPDHLNAEIVAGSVTSLKEAVSWLSYTYLYVRMLRNPMKNIDPMLEKQRKLLVETAAKKLDLCRMIRYDQKSGSLNVTNLGRVASHFYISHETIEIFNESIHSYMTDSEMLSAISHASEFNQLKLRDEEISELELISRMNPTGKANLLLQSYISGKRPNNWSRVAARMLELCKCIDKQIWWHQTTLRQFHILRSKYEVLAKIEEKNLTVEQILNSDMSTHEIGTIVRDNKMAEQMPCLKLDYTIQPITRGILRVKLTIEGTFKWNDKIHGTSEPWHIWVEDV
eukprot:GSMAST32.ASY1.ANO1.1073.1 assembled CDS